MYLDGGQIPARFQIDRYRLNFLRYILQQEESSFLYSMLKAQEDNFVKGDWFSQSQITLKELMINMTNFEIKQMSRKKFHKITQRKSKERAFKYLIEKQKN